MIFNLIDTVIYSTYFLLLFLSIFWLLVLFTSEDDKPKKKLTTFPKFTVIVPAYNEEKSILATLQSIIGLDYPKEQLEVIIVNDGSKDRTKEIAEQFIKEHPKNDLTLINQVNQGKGKALNVGLERTKGDYYACLDADSFVAPDAIKEMLPYFLENKNVGAVCPLMKVKKPDTVLKKVQWTEYVINMFHRHLNARLNCIHVTPGPFSVYKTAIIKKLGGYDETTITEDLEIAIRLQKNGYEIVQTFDTIVETVVPNTWKKLFKQRVRWYKGSVDNTIVYKKMLFNKKYGDFGIVRMPTIILSGIIAIILSLTLIYELSKNVIQEFNYLKSINFDILTLIKNYSFDFNLLTLPFAKFFIAGTLMAISLFIMIYSYRLIKENITNHGKTFITLSTYLLIYGLFLTTVWIYIAFMYVTKKKNFWS